MHHIDVKGAYLNGKLDEDIYMHQPDGFVREGTEGLVCKLNKGIYGLKQSGWVWYHTLKWELTQIGFTPGEADLTV